MVRRIGFRYLAPALLALLLSTLAAAAAEAQRRSGAAAAEGTRGVFQAGYLMLDLDELNARLLSAGYPEMDDRFLTLGGAGYRVMNRILIGGEGHGLLGREETTADATRRISLNGGYGLFRLGYLLLADYGFDLVPAIGIGGGGMSLKITERGSPTFDDVLGQPARSSTLSTGMLLVDGSVGVNYRVALGPPDRRRGGILIGLHGGYLYSPWNSSWDLDGLSDVAGGPELLIQGFYGRVTIGGWGRRGPGR